MELSLYKTNTITYRIVEGSPQRAGWIEFTVAGDDERLVFTCFSTRINQTPTLMKEEE